MGILPGWCLVEESRRVEYHLAHSQSHTVILKVFSVSGTVVGEGRVRNELVQNW